MSEKSSPRLSAPGVRSPAIDARPKNRVLARLPDEDFRRILPHLTTVPLSPKQTLLKRGAPISHVYFPNGGVCSVTAMMKNGEAVEVAMVGVEGMVGIAAFLGGTVMPGESMVQVPVADMNAERMPVEAFHDELRRRDALHDAVSRCSQASVALMMQSTGCMALHGVEQRCCRWLLMVHDRVGTDKFPLSHEFLAMMLGTARPTVSIIARRLHDAGLIRYTRARMTILDRPRLEAQSCECYAVIRTEFDRLGL